MKISTSYIDSFSTKELVDKASELDKNNTRYKDIIQNFVRRGYTMDRVSNALNIHESDKLIIFRDGDDVNLALIFNNKFYGLVLNNMTEMELLYIYKKSFHRLSLIIKEKIKTFFKEVSTINN